MPRKARFIVTFCFVTVLAGIGVYGAGELQAVKFQTVVVDAGSIKEGHRIRARFGFHNDGRRTAAILDVVPTCGTQADLVRGRTLAVGEDGEVEVRIDTAGRQGPVTGAVTVTLKDPLERTVVLTVKAFVEREFVPESSLMDFGTIAPGAPAQRELSIQLNRTEHDVASARSTDENFDAYVTSDHADGSARLVVTMRPQTQPGLRFGTIRISTSSPDLPQLIVPVRAVVATSLH